MKVTIKSATFLLGLGFILGSLMQSRAQSLTATGTIAGQPLGGGMYDYDITLNNTGETPITTFWFAWTPGHFFLQSTPTVEDTPAGWTGTLSSSGNSSIQFETSTAPLAGGDSLDFTFAAAITPAQMAGDGGSVVYDGAPFSTPNFQFSVQQVPEPSGLALLVAGGAGMCWMGRRRRGAAVGAPGR